jgi:hypothetical protein
VPELEFIVIANHAEAINGLLYLQGAGWTDIQQPVGPAGQPGVVHFGMAASILVGWNETNRRFPLKLVIVHEDGDELARVDAQIEAGRPAGLAPGSDIRSVLAVNAEAQFSKAGRYEFRAELGDKVRTTAFRVHLVGPLTPPGLQLPHAQS